MLIKRKSGEAAAGNLQALAAGLASQAMDRRAFLRRSGLAAGGLAAIGSLRFGAVKAAEGGGIGHVQPGAPIKIVKNICTHCSVGCTVTAEVQNGVWVGQEPSWDSPINRGTHCAKGAAIRETRARRPPPEISDEAGQRPVAADLLGSGHQRDRRQADGHPRASRARIPSTGSARPSSPTRAPTCSASSPPSGARTRSTTRRASATRRRSRASPTPGATARRPTPTTTSATPRPCSSSAAIRPRRIRSRCSTCSPAKEINRGNLIVVRSALHAHRGARAPNMCASAPAPTSRSSGACSGTSSRTAGRTRSSSASASTAWTTSARKSRSGHPRRSSASPACPASS